jgi:uncharacterized membrane protein
MAAARPPVARAGTRVLVAVGAGVVAFGIAMAVTAWQVAALVGWDTTAVVVLIWFAAVVVRTGEHVASMATREDDSRAAADLVVVSACVGSLAGVGVGLVKGAHEHGTAEALITALAVLTVLLSWAAVHAVFTLRYARLFYAAGGGVDFNEGIDPDYLDFLYLALTIGMTYQVSDTNLTSRPMRRTAVRHALLSWLFGTMVVAMMINVVAGLLR